MARAPEEVEFVFRIRSPSVSFSIDHREGTPALSDMYVFCQALCVAPPAFAGRDGSVRLYVGQSSLGTLFANKSVIDAVINMSEPQCWALSSAIDRRLVTTVTVFSKPLWRSAGEVTLAAFEGPNDDTTGRFRNLHEWPD